MIDNVLKDKIENFSEMGDIEIAKLFYEFKYKTVMEAATKLTQSSLLFFTITTFITAITTFTNFDEKTKSVVLYCMIVMVIVFSIIGASIMYGVVTGLIQIRETLKSISIVTYDNLKMDSYFKRGIAVLSIVSIVSILGVVAIIFIIFFVT